MWVRLVGMGEGGERDGLLVRFDPREMQPRFIFSTFELLPRFFSLIKSFCHQFILSVITFIVVSCRGGRGEAARTTQKF